MKPYDYDLFVIGAGSGGVRCARFSSQFGAKVAIAENLYLGGTCVNVGCVPKKLFVYGAQFAQAFKDSQAYGFDVKACDWDWTTLRNNKTKEIQRLNTVYQSLLEKSGATIINGLAEILDEHTVAVNGRQYSAKHILVASGSWPYVPEFPGSEHAITSNETFYLEKFPQSVTIVGGGYIGLEFANIFHGLGAEVNLIYRRDYPLRGFDHDIRRYVTDEMIAQGIQYHPKTSITKIEKTGNNYAISLNNNTQLNSECVLYATGRRPLLPKMPKDFLQINDKGAIVVDAYYRTSVASVHAIGDVIDKVQLTPVAIKEGMALANTLFNNKPTKVDYSICPTAVFSQPNIGTVGLTEEDAKAQFSNIQVYTSHFRPLKHTLTGKNEKTFMKLIVNNDDDKVVGVHILGPDAGEIIQGFGVALSAGATKACFDQTIGVHPTAAEELVTMR